ncbi:hypothetical protein FKM82_007295 [Ascaphus truei]
MRVSLGTGDPLEVRSSMRVDPMADTASNLVISWLSLQVTQYYSVNRVLPSWEQRGDFSHKPSGSHTKV